MAAADTMKGSGRNTAADEEHQDYIEYRDLCEQWANMDFVVSDAPCTFEVDPPHSKFRFVVGALFQFAFNSFYPLQSCDIPGEGSRDRGAEADKAEHCVTYLLAPG